MDNRPARIKAITAFRESSLLVKIRFPEEYTLGVLSMFFRIDRMPYDLLITPTQESGLLSISIPKEDVRTFPNRIQFYLNNDDATIITGDIYPQMGGAGVVVGEHVVNIIDEIINVVEIDGLDTFTELLQEATEIQEATQESLTEIQEILQNFPEA